MLSLDPDEWWVPTPEEWASMQAGEAGEVCHSCGVEVAPGVRILDLQPPLGGEADEREWYPHCHVCSSRQGAYVAGVARCRRPRTARTTTTTTGRPDGWRLEGSVGLGSAPLLVVDPRDAVAWRLDEPRVAALADRLAATWPCARLDVAPDGSDALVIGREADSSPAVAFRDEHGAIAVVEIVALPPSVEAGEAAALDALRRLGSSFRRLHVLPAPSGRCLLVTPVGNDLEPAAAFARGLALAIPWRGGSVAVAAARIVADDLVATAVRLAPSAG